MDLRPISQLAPRPVTWFWPGRLALGKLAMLDGDPGLGKSLLALDLCARLSTGRPFPDDAPGAGPSNAIILNAEDGAQDTTRPRLQALGADLERIFLLHFEGASGLPLRLPGQPALLDAALERTRALLVVLDPVVAFLDGSVCCNSDQGVRRALLPLVALAERHHCVVLLIRHLNKLAGGRALYRGGGSIGFLGVCRSGWLVGRDPGEPDRRVLAQVKNNLAPPQPSLAFTVQAPGGADPRLEWLGPSPLTADELLAGEPVAAAMPRRDRARDFVADFLADGPRTAREVWEAARELGLSERTLYRAREPLQVRVERVQRGTARLDYWLLPHQRLPAPPPGGDDVPDLEQWLAPLREQFPPPTPLDDL
jgi:hypothetical protein